MATLATSVVITRTELSLSDLELNTSSGDDYKVIKNELAGGALGWRRQTVTSPFVEGRALINAVKDVVISPIGIRVTGSTQADLKSKMQALVNAFTQQSYQITETIGGQVWGVYQCEPADIVIGSGSVYHTEQFIAFKQEFRAQIPRKPDPGTGVM